MARSPVQYPVRLLLQSPKQAIVLSMSAYPKPVNLIIFK